MVTTTLILTYRKKGLFPAAFRTHYNVFVYIVKELTGDLFPLAHRRSYIDREASDVIVTSWIAPPQEIQGQGDTPQEPSISCPLSLKNKTKKKKSNDIAKDKLTPETDTPTSSILGPSSSTMPAPPASHAEIGFGAVSEMTFADHEAYERYIVKTQEPEIARLLTGCVKKFMDRAMMAGAMVLWGRLVSRGGVDGLNLDSSTDHVWEC
ncbi:hypothetical protein BDW74DRAFT_181794 [Aspergillus multicolor]|uniref:uncharacterized protein n=1 Tax=Aspergillus multicolor TaxID=41759 RepID=UPI003CCE4929